MQQVASISLYLHSDPAIRRSLFAMEIKGINFEVENLKLDAFLTRAKQGMTNHFVHWMS